MLYMLPKTKLHSELNTIIRRELLILFFSLSPLFYNVLCTGCPLIRHYLVFYVCHSVSALNSSSIQYENGVGMNYFRPYSISRNITVQPCFIMY